MSDLLSGAYVESLLSKASDICNLLNGLPEEQKIEALNAIRLKLREVSPFKNEPVEAIQWIKAPLVRANDYNPNSVAPPEMKLLEHSIREDGYTQPIVTWNAGDSFEVVDGFHRHRVGKESPQVSKRIKGYLPCVVMNEDRTGRSDRIAATIRHNRARGKHKVEAMSDIVIELKRRNWSDEKIARELGMDADEVLRLCQITGLAEAFKDQEFSQAWEVGTDNGIGSELLSDVIEDYVPSDDGRILHTWEKWECYRAGFHAERPPNGMSQEQGEDAYREFLSDIGLFERTLEKVIGGWKFSCEHYLTNERMNRVAWLGQASVAMALGIPAVCRGGFSRLTQDQQYSANMMALKYLNKWLESNGREQVMLGEALGKTEAELY